MGAFRVLQQPLDDDPNKLDFKKVGIFSIPDQKFIY